MILFFQAEDGIRDYKVTGVQTCALPIYQIDDRIEQGDGPPGGRQHVDRVEGAAEESEGGDDQHRNDLQLLERSEERRVGNECRSSAGTDRYRLQVSTQEWVCRDSGCEIP